MATVKLKATELDVYVDGVRVGHIMDCGDCWRAGMYGRLRRRGMRLPDYDSRRDAVLGVVQAKNGPSKWAGNASSHIDTETGKRTDLSGEPAAPATGRQYGVRRNGMVGTPPEPIAPDAETGTAGLHCSLHLKPSPCPDCIAIAEAKTADPEHIGSFAPDGWAYIRTTGGYRIERDGNEYAITWSKENARCLVDILNRARPSDDDLESWAESKCRKCGAIHGDLVGPGLESRCPPEPIAPATFDPGDPDSFRVPSDSDNPRIGRVEPIAPSEATMGAPPDDIVVGWNPSKHELSFNRHRSDLVPVGYVRTEWHESTVAALETKLARYEAGEAPRAEAWLRAYADRHHDDRYNPPHNRDDHTKHERSLIRTLTGEMAHALSKPTEPEPSKAVTCNCAAGESCWKCQPRGQFGGSSPSTEPEPSKAVEDELCKAVYGSRRCIYEPDHPHDHCFEDLVSPPSTAAEVPDVKLRHAGASGLVVCGDGEEGVDFVPRARLEYAIRERDDSRANYRDAMSERDAARSQVSTLESRLAPLASVVDRIREALGNPDGELDVVAREMQTEAKEEVGRLEGEVHDIVVALNCDLQSETLVSAAERIYAERDAARAEVERLKTIVADDDGWETELVRILGAVSGESSVMAARRVVRERDAWKRMTAQEQTRAIDAGSKLTAETARAAQLTTDRDELVRVLAGMVEAFNGCYWRDLKPPYARCDRKATRTDVYEQRLCDEHGAGCTETRAAPALRAAVALLARMGKP